MKKPLLFYAIVWLVFCHVIGRASDPMLVVDTGGNTRYIRNALFTREGDQLVSVGDDKVIRVWDVKSGKTLRTIRDQAVICAGCDIAMIALSPDNTYLAVGGKFLGEEVETQFAIHIYDFQKGELLHSLKGHRAKVVSLVFSPNGGQLASGSAYFEEGKESDSDGVIRVWSVGPQIWQLKAMFNGHEDAVSSLAFSPDGKWLVSCSHDTDLRLWNLDKDPEETGDRLEKHHDEQVLGVVFSPDGRYLVSGGLDGKINLWEAQGKFVKVLAQTQSGITSIDFSPNNDHPAVLAGLENGMSAVFSVPEGVVVSCFERGDDKVLTAKFSHSRENVVATSGGYDGEIWIWQASSGLPFGSGVLTGSGKTIWSVGFAKDGNSIAFGTEHRTDSPNKYASLQEVFRLKPSESGNLKDQQAIPYRVSLGGKIASTADFETALVKSGGYELRTRYGQTIKRRIGPGRFVDEPVRLNELQVFKNDKLISTISRNSTTGRTHRCFTLTPDGNYIVSGGEGGYLALYDAKTGRLVHNFVGHTNDVWAVAVSLNGRFVVSGSSDQTLKLWDLKSEQYTLSIFVASDYEWVACTPQGYYTSSLNGDRYFGWLLPDATGAAPKFYNASQFRKTFYRPDIISEYLATPDIQTAAEQADKSEWGNSRTAGETSFPVDQHTTSALLEALPPEVHVVIPGLNEASGKSTVQYSRLPIEIAVFSRNLPITEVSVGLNGIRKGTFTGDPASKDGSRPVMIQMVLTLEPGENLLVVRASHERATSKPQIWRITYQPQRKPQEFVKPAAVEIAPVPTLFPGDKGRSGSGLAHFSLVNYDFANDSKSASLASGIAEVTKPGLVGRPLSVATSPADTTPVRFTVIEPENGLVTEDDNLNIKAVAFSSDVATRITVILNGQQVAKSAIDPNGKLWFMQVTLESEGENTLSIVVSNGTTATEPEIRKIIFHPRASKKANLIFLGIGVSAYQALQPSLDFADADARDMARLFCPQKGENQLFNDVKAMTLTNDQANRTTILNALDWLNDEAKYDNDVRVLLLSGHGGRGANSQYYFYSPAQRRKPTGEMENEEVESVSWDVIWRVLAKKPGTVLLFVDTCRAGTINPKDLIRDSDRDQASIVFFGASGPDERSLELSDPQFKHGAFAQAIIEGLSGRADVAEDDSPKDGRIDFDELNLYIKRRVRQLTGGAQNPSYLPNPFLPSFFITSHLPSSSVSSSTDCPKEGITP